MRTDRYFKMSDGEREIVWRRLYNIMCDRKEEHLQMGHDLPMTYFFDIALFEAEIVEQFALCQAIVDAAHFFKIDIEYHGPKPQLDK